MGNHNGITDQLKLWTYVQQPMHVRPLPYARTCIAYCTYVSFKVVRRPRRTTQARKCIP